MENDEIPEWRKIITTDGEWIGMERTQFLSIHEAIKQGYEPQPYTNKTIWKKRFKGD